MLFRSSDVPVSYTHLDVYKRQLTNYELTARARDGKTTVVSYNATTFYDRDRKLQGVFAAARDVTEPKRLDQALKEQNVELKRARSAAEKANLAKSDFLSSMSHELRSPLNAILGFAQLMNSDTPPPTSAQTASIDQILHAGWYLLELINEILDLAQKMCIRDRRQPGQQEQFQMLPIDVQQRQPSARFAQLGESEYQRAQPGAVDVGDLFEVQDDMDFAGSMDRRQPLTQGQIPVTQHEGALEVENDDPFFFPLFDLQAHMPRLRVSMQYLSSNVRPKFSTEIADEIEPEVEGTLQRAEADGIYAVRIPFVGEEGSSVVAAQAPGGQCLAAAVGARENSAAKCVSRSAQKACIVRAKISRVLV